MFGRGGDRREALRDELCLLAPGLTLSRCYDSRQLTDAEAVEFNRVFREELISE